MIDTTYDHARNPLIHDGEATWNIEHEGQDIEFTIFFQFFYSYGTMYCTEVYSTPVGLDPETAMEAILNEIGPNIRFDETNFN